MGNNCLTTFSLGAGVGGGRQVQDMTAAMSHTLLQSSEDSPLDLDTKGGTECIQPNRLPAKFPLSQIISPVFLLKAVFQVFLGKGGAIEQRPREGSPERCSDTAYSRS